MNSLKYLKQKIEDEDEDLKCIHGYPMSEYCEQCEIINEGDDKYHALKDDGLL